MIYIKTDMKEMPKGCARQHAKMCPFFKREEFLQDLKGYFSVCKANRGAGWKVITDLESRPAWCPLIEKKEEKATALLSMVLEGLTRMCNHCADRDCENCWSNDICEQIKKFLEDR